jgi:hypothetical protein
LSINIDDITNTSIKPIENTDASSERIISGKFLGLGSDDTVGANKVSLIWLIKKREYKINLYK